MSASDSPPGIKRRTLLAGLSASAVALAACEKHSPQEPIAADPRASAAGPFDVAIIGGGFAGVTAARDLSLRGHRTVLLEARPRLGGRTFTSTFSTHQVDFGGTWIGLEQPFVWAERMRYGIGIQESAAFTRPDKAIYFAGGQRHEVAPQDYAELFARATRKFMAPAMEVFPRPFEPFFSNAYERYDSLSSQDAIQSLKLSQPELDIVSGFAAINGHNYLDKIGYLDQLKWYALGAYDPLRLFENCGRFRLAGGTGALLDAMAKDSRAEVRLSHPITTVSRDGDVYRLKAEGGEIISARKVLVAVPLNTLGNIRFEPGISAAKLAASRERITGAGTKLYVKLKGKVPVFSAQGPEKSPLLFFWTEYVDADSQIAVGFGPDPNLLDVNDTEAVQKVVDRFVPGAEVEEVAGYDWNGDPYSQGTWCMYRPMFFTRYLRELQTAEGGLYFAGSDTANGWRGFIDGAIESGARAAVAIHTSLGA